MHEDTVVETQSKMQKSVEVLRRDLAGIRSSRATPALVQNIKVDYYGVPTPLNQLANISVPDVKMLMIHPWDKTTIGSIEKAIMKSDLGLNPANDGTVIRLSIPALSEERRIELVRLVGKRVEESRITLRNIRREAIEKLRNFEKEKQISQDDLHRTTDALQKVVDNFISQVNEIGEMKEAELMEV